MGMTLFACMDAVSKHLTTSLPIVEILWVRYSLFTLFGLVMALSLGGIVSLRTNMLKLQIFRGFAMLGDIALFTLSFRFMQLAEAHAIAAIAPLMVMALAVPLLLGSYVDVTFSAGQKANLISIPRTSLHDGNNVYIVKDGKLEIRKVEIAWRRIDSVLVNKGVQAGEQLVVSRLVAPVNGMKLRVEGSVSQDASKPPKGKTQRGKP